MSGQNSFNPYYRWLGIPPEEQPPNHYRLLGVQRFEPEPDVIDSAADRQMAHLRSVAAGDRAAIAQRLLNEIATARTCLLNPASRAEYDTQLQATLAPNRQPGQIATPPEPIPPVGPRVQGTAVAVAAQAAPLAVGQAVIPRDATSNSPSVVQRRRGAGPAPLWKNPLVMIGAPVGLASVIILLVLLSSLGSTPVPGEPKEPATARPPASLPGPTTVAARPSPVSRPTPPPARPAGGSAAMVSVPQTPTPSPTSNTTPASTPANVPASAPVNVPAIAAPLREPAVLDFQSPTAPIGVSVSDDGTVVLVHDGKRTARFFASQSGEEIREEMTNTVACGFLTDGHTMYSLPWEGHFHLWDVQTRAAVGRGARGWQSRVAAISPDGQWSAIGQSNNNLTIADVATWKDLHKVEVQGRRSSVAGVIFSPDSKHVLAVTAAGEATLYEVETGQLVVTFGDSLRSVLAVLPDGRLLSRNYHEKRDLWTHDLATGKRTADQWIGHTDTINDIAVGPDGTFVTVSDDMTARRWNTSTGKNEILWRHTSPLRAARFSNNQSHLAVAAADGATRVWILFADH